MDKDQIEARTQLEKRNQEIDSLTRQIAKFERDKLASEVAVEHGLPAELAGLLGDTDRESMKANAKLLKESLARNGKGPAPAPAPAPARPAARPAPEQSQAGQTQQTKTYSFQRPGEVAYPPKGTNNAPSRPGEVPWPV